MMANELMIREATIEDVPELVQLVNEAYAIEDFLEGTRTDTERMQGDLLKGKILVARSNEAGPLLACVFLTMRRARSENEQRRGYLGMLAVAREAQGMGLARHMFMRAEDELREMGCKSVEISVLSLRSELLPMYAKLGFEVTGTEPFGFHRALKPGVECHTILLAKSLI